VLQIFDSFIIYMLIKNMACLFYTFDTGGFSRAVLELLRAGASPAMSDIRQRFPYFLAKDRETREAFRR
jgi:hypothetical protein